MIFVVTHYVWKYVWWLLVNQKGKPWVEPNDRFSVKFGMWVVLSQRVTNVVCHHGMHVFSRSRIKSHQNVFIDISGKKKAPGIKECVTAVQKELTTQKEVKQENKNTSDDGER